MPLTVRKFKAKVRDSQTGNMIPAGLLSSDALEAIEDAKDLALDEIDDQVDIATDAAAAAQESAQSAASAALTGNLAPQYSGTATYEIGDHVLQNGTLYRCNTTISSPQSTFVAAHWTQVKIGPQVDDIIKINQPADDGTKIRVVTSNEDVDLVTVEDLDDYVPRPEDDPSGTAGYVLRTNGDGTTQWADEARPTDTQTQNAVNAWMESHSGQYIIPDGNVTEAKLSDDLKLKTIKDYVTPEMFGAIGDNVNDDTSAIQNAINSGKPVLLLSNYLTTLPLEISNSCQIFGNSQSGIRYTGNLSAIKIYAINNYTSISFGILRSAGNGIEFYTDSANTRCQYIKISIDMIYVSGYGIYFNRNSELSVAEGGWLNAIIIKNVVFKNGTYGIYADAKNYNAINDIKVINCAFEGVSNGVYVADGCRNWILYNCRSSELHANGGTLLNGVGIVDGIIIVSNSFIYENDITVSNRTNGAIIAMIRSTQETFIGNFASIDNGVLNIISATDIKNLQTQYNELTTNVIFKKRITGINSSSTKDILTLNVVPSTENAVYKLMCSTSNAGDVLSEYTVRVANGEITDVVAIREGTANPSPRISNTGVLTKKNTTSTSAIDIIVFPFK